MKNPYRYRGYRYDTETGLHNLTAGIMSRACRFDYAFDYLKLIKREDILIVQKVFSFYLNKVLIISRVMI